MQFQFESVADFLAMGGYSFYVWLAYGLSFLAMAILIVKTINEKKQLFKQIKKQQQAKQYAQNRP